MLYAKPVTVGNVAAMRVSLKVNWPNVSLVGWYLKPCAIRTCPSALGGLFSLPWSVGPGHELTPNQTIMATRKRDDEKKKFKMNDNENKNKTKQRSTCMSPCSD
ncbi:Oligouridylate-binding protein 1A [Fusarium oxysporum f. sp. albedinis]|nr:Oligouridylate-binding protein 1A [Fusarium oxysporum f. sp. albedinis]